MNLSKKWEECTLNINSSLRDAIDSLEVTRSKIVLVKDQEDRFIGTITDGDIRRAMVAGHTLEDDILNVVNQSSYYVCEDYLEENVLPVMLEKKIQHVPVVDSKKRLVGLIYLDPLFVGSRINNYFVVMAGGKGTRLRPFTEHCPKPLLSIAGKPILLHLIEKAKAEGFYNFIFSIGYLGEMIKEYFGNGNKFGVNIQYVEEKIAMGTAGSLRNIPRELLVEPFIVTNGDVLIDMEYRDFLKYHLQQKAKATMVTKPHKIQHPYGVVQIFENNIIDIQEKPVWETRINAGVYALSPEALTYLESSTYFDMPELFKKLQLKNRTIKSYPIDGVWHDIGRPEDLTFADEYLRLKLNINSDK